MPPMRARLWRAVATRAQSGARWLEDVARVARFRGEVLRFEPRADDVYVASYPRSGTTWMQTIVHLLHRPRSASLDLDFEHIDDVVPWFERSLSVGTRCAADFEAMSSPRCFKTHLVPRWLPAGGRVVLLRRNALDMGLSYYRLYADYLGFEGSLDAFFGRLARGDVQYGAPAAHWAAWRTWRGPLLHVDYEALRADPHREVARVARFLGLQADARRIEAVVRATRIEAMRGAQEKFDHATSLLRERGVRPRNFIRDGLGAKGVSEGVRTLAQRVDAGVHADARAPLQSFLR